MSELAYSLHLGSDKNRKNVSRTKAKSNTSGTTSLSNNAIQNARQLSRVDKHNYRKYDDKQHLIEIVRGTTSLYDDVQKLYRDEFEEARLEYNSKQTKDDRKIDDYFKKISDNSKNDLACEIIIELGNKKYWDTKDNKFIQQVDSTSEEYKKMQKLSITLNDVETELKENRKKVKILTENNETLELRVKTLTEKNKLKAENLGQMNMYLNYYEQVVNSEEDGKQIGIILCAEKDKVMLEYALSSLSNNIFASTYTYYIPINW